MAVPRYSSGDVSPAPLGRNLEFPVSGRIAKNRFLKSPMAETLATWSPRHVYERGIPTDELVELYRRLVIPSFFLVCKLLIVRTNGHPSFADGGKERITGVSLLPEILIQTGPWSMAQAT